MKTKTQPKNQSKIKVRLFSAAKLISAKYNPPSRINPKNIKSLKDSIKSHGILQPILVDSKLNIIDGHRRVTCAKQLKMSIPCIIIDSKINTKEQFNNVNSTSRKITSRDMIYIYLNGGVVSKKTQQDIIELQSIIGNDNLKKLANSQTSTLILGYSKRIASYCDIRDNGDFLKKTILWMFKHKMSNQVRRAIESNLSPSILKKAINLNLPLKTTQTV